MIFSDSITKEEIKDLPLTRFDGKIHVVDKTRDVSKALKILRKEPFLGFDTEKKPTFLKGQYHPTALVQLSTREEVFLFRVNHIGIPVPLKDLLENESIRKIGVGIRDDLVELKKLSPFKPGGFIELNSLTKSLGIKQAGVRNLAAILLQGRISKNQQTSNWENGKLTISQQQYAATDAWICGEMYHVLKQKGYIE